MSSRHHHGHQTRAMSPCNLTALIQDISRRYARTEPGVDFTTPGEDNIIEGDIQGLQTLFSNLFDNALKYSAHQKKPVSVKLSQAKDSCNITIRDHGPGIEKKDLPLLFEPFYRADDSRSRQSGGFGLGLSICRTIVKAHNGSITISSIPGQGTTAKVSLPLRQDGHSAYREAAAREA